MANIVSTKSCGVESIESVAAFGLTAIAVRVFGATALAIIRGIRREPIFDVN
jgi:hypothetical protein